MNKSAKQTLIKSPQQNLKRRGQGSSTVFLGDARDWGAGTGRVYIKRQHDYSCRPLWRGFLKTPTLRREHRALHCCQQFGVKVPRVVAYQEEGGKAELVLEEIVGAAPLDQALDAGETDRGAIIRNVASVIGTLHRAGWTHGALYPDHILVGPGPGYEVTLIDLEKARRSFFRRGSELKRFWRYNRGWSPAEVDLFQKQYHAALK